jgi:hypothetical protein
MLSVQRMTSFGYFERIPGKSIQYSVWVALQFGTNIQSSCTDLREGLAEVKETENIPQKP